jgi:exonuclease SbcD
MGKRLGFVDRTDDLKRAIRHIADICAREQVDVLLICGDLFDGSTRPELVRDWIDFLSHTFNPFLLAGGTILALTGNHDNEHLCHMLRQAMSLAAPTPDQPGNLLHSGRLYLFPGPTFFRMADDDNSEVQFVVMPSPTVTRYLNGHAQRFTSPEERNRALKTAYRQRIDEFQAEAAFDKTKHTVLAAHVATSGADVGTGRALSDADGVVLGDGELPTGYAYVALGDIHRPQALLNLDHVRYCGSIDRMDLGEADEPKGLVLVDIGRAGRVGEPRWVPLEATPIYVVRIDDPPTQMPTLADRYPDSERALVKLHVRYQPGRDNLPTMLAELDRLFPRCYARQIDEISTNGDGRASDADQNGTHAARSIEQTARDYLGHRLADDDPDRIALLALLDDLLLEERDA